MRTAVIVGAVIATGAVLALGGCNKGGSSGATGASASADAGGAPTAGAAFPVRKSGLWSIARLRDGKAAVQGMGGGAMKLCIDSKSDAKMGALGAGMVKSLCTQQTTTRGLDGSWSFSSTCQFGPGGTTKSTGTARGDFATSYSVHTESDTEGSQLPGMNGHHVTDLTATYAGPCPADMQPGDVLLANGMKINPEKMMAGGPHPAPPGGQD
jgi:hypothetical protein